MPHIAVIDPGTRQPELGSFNRIARAAPIPVTHHLPALFGVSSLLAEGDGLVGVIVLGSGASVHDDLAWQHDLIAWLRPRLAAGVPMLGLCYGHQLLATMLGGTVGYVRDDHEKLRGARTIVVPADPWWGPGGVGSMVVSHREMVTSLPGSCAVLAASDAVPVEAFAHRDLPVRGFQPHPEATPDFISGNQIPYDGPAGALAFGHGLVDAFVAAAAHGAKATSSGRASVVP
jgi:GMP synthase (glutamine-hydrolysing)